MLMLPGEVGMSVWHGGDRLADIVNLERKLKVNLS
jgi:hypothetical protein